MLRIDTHHHVIPADYRKALQKAGLGEAGGRAVPDWSVDASLQAMAELNVGTAILSVSTPGTAFLPNPTDAAALARDVNDYAATLTAAQPDRFGLFATVPMPHIDIAVAGAVRALDELNADGVVLLANNAGAYLGEDGQDGAVRRPQRSLGSGLHPPRRAAGPDRARRATVRGRLPARHHPGRLLAGAQRHSRPLPEHPVHSEPRRGFRAVCQSPDGRGHHRRHRPRWADVLDDFASFYFDTALSSSAAALPTLLAFAKPGHITFGSDFPFAPTAAGKLFAAGLETYPAIDAETRGAIERTNALALFPRLGAAPQPIPQSTAQRLRHTVSRSVLRGVTRFTNTK